MGFSWGCAAERSGWPLAGVFSAQGTRVAPWGRDGRLGPARPLPGPVCAGVPTCPPVPCLPWADLLELLLDQCTRTRVARAMPDKIRASLS